MKPLIATIIGGNNISLRKDPASFEDSDEIVTTLPLGSKVKVMSLKPYYGKFNRIYLKCETESEEGYIVADALQFANPQPYTTTKEGNNGR